LFVLLLTPSARLWAVLPSVVSHRACVRSPFMRQRVSCACCPLQARLDPEEAARKGVFCKATVAWSRSSPHISAHVNSCRPTETHLQHTAHSIHHGPASDPPVNVRSVSVIQTFLLKLPLL
jgi:hypothetical protein